MGIKLIGRAARRLSSVGGDGGDAIFGDEDAEGAPPRWSAPTSRTERSIPPSWRVRPGTTSSGRVTEKCDGGVSVGGERGRGGGGGGGGECGGEGGGEPTLSLSAAGARAADAAVGSATRRD